ncbi:MAG: M4 family metallopeptidase [candidate division Zixibacteria bacterium]|nr:M4 family metallopeptidase [candidate division Zixibacteria bacterium]
MRKVVVLVLVLFVLSAPQILASGKAIPIQNSQKATEKVSLLKARDNALARLKSQSKFKVDVRFDENGIPTLLKGKFSSSASGDKKDFALGFLEEYKDLFLLKDPTVELKTKSVRKDRAGNTHIRFDQTYQDIPVWGAQLLVHYHKDGYIKSVNGRWEPTPKIDITPTLSKEDALKIAKDDLSSSLSKEPQIELLIFPWQNQTYLAYEITLIPDLAHNWKYFVDAKTGKILLKYNDVKYDGPVTATGIMLDSSIVSLNAYVYEDTIWLIDATKPMYVPPIDNPQGIIATFDSHGGTILGDAVFDPNFDTLFNDNDSLKAAVSAHYNLGLIYDYFYSTFDRNSWDDNGGNLVSVVHYESNYDNAFWNRSYMCFGDGDTLFSSLSGALDVVAHEFGHAVTQATGSLIYLGEWGALNEHLSDVWGAMLDREDWLIGEDVTIKSPGFMRNMADPHQGMPTNPHLPYAQPAHMSEYVYYPWQSGDTPYDNGGVHCNNGIPNKACYLLATAVTRDTAEQLYYDALTNYLFPKSRFVDLKWSLLQSAEYLYSSAPNYDHIISSITDAFNSVGIEDYFDTGVDTLAYDDGNEYYTLYSDSNYSYAVRFTPHAPCSLLAVIASFYTTGNNANLHVWKDSMVGDSGYGIPGTELCSLNINRTITYPYWQEIDLSSYNLYFDQDFYVGFTATELDSFLLTDSINSNHYRAYYDTGLGWFVIPPGEDSIPGDPLIRAIVQYDSTAPSGIDEGNIVFVPHSFTLYQNYPNPFNPTTTIEYSLPTRSHIVIDIYNILGQKINTVVDRTESMGNHTANWNGSNYEGKAVSSQRSTPFLSKIGNCGRRVIIV